MGDRREVRHIVVPRDRSSVLDGLESCPCGSGLRFARCHGDEGFLPKRPVTAMNDLDDIRQVPRPVFLETGDDDYPLRRTGSCFLVAFHGDVWIVTAKHVLQGHSPSELKILRSDEWRKPEFFELGETLEPSDPRDPEDTAWEDVIVVRVVEPAGDVMVVDLDTTALARLSMARTTDYVRVVGYPRALDNAINYPELTIHISAFSNDGRYAGPTESKLVHRIEFEDFGTVTDVHGMSGGPAFLAREEEATWWFAGVVIQGSVVSKSLRFVDGEVVAQTLERYYASKQRRR